MCRSIAASLGMRVSQGKLVKEAEILDFPSATPKLRPAGVPLVVVCPGRQGEKQVARLSDIAVPRVGQAALDKHRAHCWGFATYTYTTTCALRG